MLLRLLCVSIVVAACGADGGRSPGDGGNNPNTGDGHAPDAAPPESSGSFSLSVTDAAQRLALGTVIAPTGKLFTELGMKLANMNETVPLPADAMKFSIQTATGLVFPSDPFATVPTPCPSTVGVAKGGSITCRLAFELPNNAVPMRLLYADATGRTANAPIANVMPAPTTCMHWKPTLTQACSDCLTAAAQPGAPCGTTWSTFSSACNTEITNSCMENLPCLTMKSTCTPSPQCTAALTAQRNCELPRCDAACR